MPRNWRSHMSIVLLAIPALAAPALAQAVTGDASQGTAASVQVEAQVAAEPDQLVTVRSMPNDPIRSNFLATDADGNGSIDRSEAAADAGLAAQFDRFDADGDGRLSLAEYKAWRDWR
ncbi:MAG: hypothetical protein ACLGHW_00330 [Gammaproteobacteria bacterium]|jgi:hypothetical protein